MVVPFAIKVVLRTTFALNFTAKWKHVLIMMKAQRTGNDASTLSVTCYQLLVAAVTSTKTSMWTLLSSSAELDTMICALSLLRQSWEINRSQNKGLCIVLAQSSTPA